jgi:hypothetical protein
MTHTQCSAKEWLAERYDLSFEPRGLFTSRRIFVIAPHRSTFREAHLRTTALEGRARGGGVSDWLRRDNIHDLKLPSGGLD